MTTKQEIIKIAKDEIGGFINTNGEWCMYNRPIELANYIESLGFKIKMCYRTATCSAIVITQDNYKMTHNGHVCKIKNCD